MSVCNLRSVRHVCVLYFTQSGEAELSELSPPMTSKLCTLSQLLRLRANSASWQNIWGFCERTVRGGGGTVTDIHSPIAFKESVAVDRGRRWEGARGRKKIESKIPEMIYCAFSRHF